MYLQEAFFQECVHLSNICILEYCWIMARARNGARSAGHGAFSVVRYARTIQKAHLEGKDEGGL